MSDTMLAARLDYRDRSLTVAPVPLPQPGPGEVRVRVRAAGVCLSDIHLLDGTLPPSPFGAATVTLGHEVAGEVDALGAGVNDVAIGDRVILEAGKMLDGNAWTLGVDYDGGWAEYALSAADAVIPIPDELPFEQAAIIPDAVSTPWAAIEETGRVRAGESVGVWGIGGLGVHAVQLLRAIGASPIIAIDPSATARERAIARGADLALDPASETFAEDLARSTRGRGLDVAFDFAGVARARSQALGALGQGGRLVLVGISGGPIVIDSDLDFQSSGKQLLGHYGSAGRHVRQVVDLVASGRLDLGASVTDIVPLVDAADAVRRLASERGDTIRMVLRP